MGEEMDTPQRRFGFYEIVEVRDTVRTRDQRIAGKAGMVLGIAEPDSADGTITYAVQLDGSSDAWSVDERDLVGTGEFAGRDEYYSGDSIRVTQSGEALED